MMESFKMITQSELKELLHYDPNTGLFSRSESRKGKPGIKTKVGYKTPGGYMRALLKNRKYLLHRLAWLYVYAEWPKNNIDHINHDRLDNRIINLRDVTSKENSRNMAFSNRNTSGVMGVSLNKRDKKWHAYLRINDNQKLLGAFKDKFEAICCRKSAERKYNYHENHGK